MNKFSYKYRIYALIVCWIAAVGILFGYFFGLLNTRNAAKVEELVVKKKELLELQAEQKSFQLGKADLENLEKKEIKPENFFSKDTSLVKEIQSLENLAASNKVKLNLGISGTSTSLTKAKTTSELLVVPYSMQVEGTYSDVVRFMQGLEFLTFITHARVLSIQATTNGSVSATLSMMFYIKK